MFSPTTAHPPNEESRDFSRLFRCSDNTDQAALEIQLVRAVRCGADLDVGHFTALENGKGRDGAHAELGGDFRVFVDVDLHDLHLAGHLVGNFLKARGDHLARAAPFGPEINDHGLCRIENFSLKIGIVDFYRSHGLLLCR
jgi:hypothetical protein